MANGCWEYLAWGWRRCIRLNLYAYFSRTEGSEIGELQHRYLFLYYIVITNDWLRVETSRSVNLNGNAVKFPFCNNRRVLFAPRNYIKM